MRGAWIEMLVKQNSTAVISSLPVRGAWIEMSRSKSGRTLGASLPVRGAWIEIDGVFLQHSPKSGRSPCGERGLKSSSRNARDNQVGVAPRAGSVD